MGVTKGTGDVDVADAIGALEVERVVIGPSEPRSVPLGSLWAEQPVLIHLLRRFGCQLCRAGALEMGKIFPQLEAHGIRIVGIGLESVGLEEFRKGGFWNGGELYIDDHGKKIHKALSFPKVGVLNTLKMLVANKDVKSALKKSKDTAGDLKGDGRQLGGTFVIARGGATLLEFRQAHFGDHASNAAILEALGLDATSAVLPASPAPVPVQVFLPSQAPPKCLCCIDDEVHLRITSATYGTLYMRESQFKHSTLAPAPVYTH